MILLVEAGNTFACDDEDYLGARDDVFPDQPKSMCYVGKEAHNHKVEVCQGHRPELILSGA
jgi:hypothetical protein